mmetsp:Transcript_18889/g.53694  ORF Transcript_18889/g.53694 Transcript_18889/m.53694 type:complete len:209 (+) Transcript_18889:153-779(+)
MYYRAALTPSYINCVNCPGLYPFVSIASNAAPNSRNQAPLSRAKSRKIRNVAARSQSGRSPPLPGKEHPVSWPLLSMSSVKSYANAKSAFKKKSRGPPCNLRVVGGAPPPPPAKRHKYWLLSPICSSKLPPITRPKNWLSRLVSFGTHRPSTRPELPALNWPNVWAPMMATVCRSSKPKWVLKYPNKSGVVRWMDGIVRESPPFGSSC